MLFRKGAIMNETQNTLTAEFFDFMVAAYELGPSLSRLVWHGPPSKEHR
jgi:hypothetical protein